MSVAHLIIVRPDSPHEQKMTRPARRGPWLPEEDRALLQLVQPKGANNWVSISHQIQHRSPKQCRERYHQNLKPSLKHEPISLQEGERIEEMVAEMGKRWAEIARRLGNRSDNAVKNWWNGSMNRRRRNPTQTMTGFKQVGSRLQPVHFTQADSNAYALQHRPQYDSQLPPSNSNQWPLHGVDTMTSRRPSLLQIPSPMPTNDSVATDRSPTLSYDPRVTQQPSTHSQPSMTQQGEAGRSSYPTSASIFANERRPELPPLQSGSTFTNRFDKRDCSIFEPPLISPALSEASQPISARHAPSLVSDNQSTQSISPRTITSPKSGVLTPIEQGTKLHHMTWQDPSTGHSRLPRVALMNQGEEATHKSYLHHHHHHHHSSLSLEPSLRKSHEMLSGISNARDSRMHLSSLLD